MKTLIPEDQLRQGIARLAGEIRKHYAGKPLTLVGVFVGSVVLLADLIRLLDIPFRVDLLQARANGSGGTGPGPLAIDPQLLVAGIRGRDILLVDDIFDTGNTIWDLIPQLDELGPETVRVAVLLRKQGRCRVPRQPDFVGFDIPDAFVVGYGLDFEDRYRNLPYIAALEPQEMGANKPA
jgi:hypoxanthine phosphoribosyltransferase